MPIYCEDFVIKFIQATGLNDMRIRYHECSGCTVMKVEREGDMLHLHFMKYRNTVNSDLITVKTISWNFARVAEFNCEDLHEFNPNDSVAAAIRHNVATCKNEDCDVCSG